MRHFKILFLFLLIAAAATAVSAKFKTGDELITAMHKKYDGKWYKTLTFVQKNTAYKPDGTTENSTWYEAMNAPGRLRIDFDPLDKRDGAIYADNKQYSFKDGKLADTRPLVHSLLVLGFDVYVQPVETTINQLKELKFDLSVLHEEKWEGKDVYVVGAKQGDLKTAQFWIDKKNLLFVRMIQTVGKNKDHLQEVQFNKYQKVKSGGWVSAEVVFMIDGKRNWMEEYTDMQTNVALDSNLFDPQKWMTVDRKYFSKK
ncbi:hypothetical protein BH10ACI1_BH10ACI1_20330 [soil metagenome]